MAKTTSSDTKLTSASASRHLVESAVDGRSLGRVAHQVVASIVGVGIYRPTPLELRHCVAAHPAVRDPRVIYRQAGKQRVLTATSIYFRMFCPAENWTLLGAEVPCGSSRFDLVWQTPDGVLVDELKSSRATDPFEKKAIDEQASRGVENATRKYGNSFLGVRVCLLAAPARSFLLDPTGRRHPIAWEVG